MIEHKSSSILVHPMNPSRINVAVTIKEQTQVACLSSIEVLLVCKGDYFLLTVSIYLIYILFK